MSLVDYASSSDDDDDDVLEEDKHEPEPEPVPEAPQFGPEAPPTLPHSLKPGLSSHQQPKGASHLPAPFIELPDASVLLNSPAIPSHLASGDDHSSRVAAAMAESSSRKRDSKGLASSLPRGKVPRGTLPHSRNVLDTVGGALVPPQLRGRSNIVTEDLGKLFARKHDPSSG